LQQKDIMLVDMTSKIAGRQQQLANLFEKIGYFVVFMEWLFLVGIYLPGFIDSGLGRLFFPRGEAPPPQAQHSVATSTSSGITIASATALSLCLIGLVVYAVLKKYIPAVTHVSRKTLEVTAEKTVPIVVHTPLPKISKRKRRALTDRILFWVKLGAATLPLLIIAVSRVGNASLESQLVLFAFACLTAISCMAFLLHRYFASR